MTSSISQADQANQMRRAWPVAVACRASIIGSSIAWLLLVGPRHATPPLVRRRQGIGIFKSPPCSLVLKPFRLHSIRASYSYAASRGDDHHFLFVAAVINRRSHSTAAAACTHREREMRREKRREGSG